MARRRRRGANRSRVDARRRRRHRASQGRVGARRRAGGGGASRRVGIPPAAGWVRFWRSASWAEPAAAGAKEIKIRADNINDAAEKIIGFLKGPNTGDVIYFNGWVGLGASPVLKAVVERLTRPSSASASTAGKGGGTRMEEVGVDKVIHIDCSQWRNKRALQRAIAEELKLPQRVLAIFDQQDEEDDYDGVEQGSRGVIPRVKWAIFNELSSCTFLVVFHNGSGSYIDLWECGVPLMGVASKKVLWATSQGRFHIRPEQGMTKESAGSSDVAILAEPARDSDDFARRLLHIEAEEVAGLGLGHHNSMSPKVVLGCLLYRALRHEEYGIDWATHAANYWVCDGGILPVNGDAIINGGTSAWEICDAVHRNINLEFCKDVAQGICELLSGDGGEWRQSSDRWVLATHQKTATEIRVPPKATSFFYTTATTQASASTTDDGNNAAVATVMLEDSMFGHSDDGSNLQVLHLCYCTFSFSSPPFRRCRKLRFLLLHQCKDKDGAPVAAAAETSAANQGLGSSAACCFQKSLWVLELSHTEWHWLLSEETLAQMDELRELHLKGVGFIKRLTNKCYGKNSQSSTLLIPNLTKLRLILETGEDDIDEVDMSFSSILNTVQLINGTKDTKVVERISLRGCTQMKNLHLRGPSLGVVELDLSGTQIETLDLSAAPHRFTPPSFRRLFLLGCEKLRAILWPREDWMPLEVLRIDTTTNHAEWRADREGKSSKHEDNRPHHHIYVRDTRLFRSLVWVRLSGGVRVEISSTHAGQGIINSSTRGDREQQVRRHANLYNADGIISTFKDNSEASGMTWWMWPCPNIPTNSKWSDCYIQDETPTEILLQSAKQENRATTLPGFVSWDAKTLHLHDSLSITSIPGPIPPTMQNDYYFSWSNLMWCRLERCPNMEGSVFTAPAKDWGLVSSDIFEYLETFWASQLLKARYIWDWSETGFRPEYDSFKDLVFLHLDCCPRLVHVLPLYDFNSEGCQSLETLEIVRCGELREVFPSDASESQQQGQPRKFPKLKRVHLYDLPKLQRIYGRRMLAPNLETVKVRGCWGLKRLPAVRQHARPAKEEKEAKALPEVDCEKDWWDGLEWDGEDAGHLPSHYRKRHSAYYKETRLRSSVLSYVFAYVFVTTVSSSGFQGNSAFCKRNTSNKEGGQSIVSFSSLSSSNF
ncbi:hypothetical protein U9M48_030990 [Paspalum notatum var. saurae]|uniref:Disease resistance protein At4g27190-like leucine-rich repeats domain-containing protein n=1 Tax=Paspalum notatum var. saurae TaxID=547442 RepID=A0AAQ3U1P1_PASNO